MSHLLSLIGRLLSFHGARVRKCHLDFIQARVISLLGSATGQFRRSTATRGLLLGLSLSLPRLCIFISGRTVAGVFDGLFAGTVGCTSNDVVVHLRLSPSCRAFAVSFVGSNAPVPTRLGRGVFRPFFQIGRNTASGPKAKLKLPLTHSLTRVRRNDLRLRAFTSDPFVAVFHLALPIGLPRSVGRARRRTVARAMPRGVRFIRSRSHPAVLVIRSGGRVTIFVTSRIGRLCGMRVTKGKTRTVALLGGRDVRLVVDSIVVPIVSNFTLLGRMGARVRFDRVPIVLLATGGAVRSHLRNLRLKTSTCLSGPFSAGLLVTRVSGLVSGHSGVHGFCFGSPVTGVGSVTCAGTSRDFLRGLGRVVGRRVNGPTLSMGVVTSLVRLDHPALCQGVHTVSSLAPGRLVGVDHLGGTTRLLVRKGVGVCRVSRTANFDSRSCF